MKNLPRATLLSFNVHNYMCKVSGLKRYKIQELKNKVDLFPENNAYKVQ